MRRFILLIAMLGVAILSLADGSIAVTSVEAYQRYPWNELVDITVTIRGATNEIAQTYCTFVSTNSATGSAVKIATINQVGVDLYTRDACIRRYLWNAFADVGAIRIDDVALTIDVKLLSGVQLWEQGPYWAESNLGATRPEEFGYYFWWGDTVGYRPNANNDGWESVTDGTKFCFSKENCPTFQKDNDTLHALGYLNSMGKLAAAYDAATVHLNPPWRMPTASEVDALINNCKHTWTMRNGVWGQLVEGKGAFASKSIFLPAAGYGSEFGISYGLSKPQGYYWASMPNAGYYFGRYGIGINSQYFYREDNFFRYFGRTVRPLRDSSKCCTD